ncbi:MAG: FAD-dependent oxidoreductase, partial [Chloroflexota bacterium]
MTISVESINHPTPDNDPECTPCVAEAVLNTNGATRPNGEELATRLQAKYPHTIETLRKMEGGLTHLEYITALDERWGKLAQGQMPIEGEVLVAVPTVVELPKVDRNFDIVYCGGVLGLFSAAVLARMGWKVMVFDQRRVGTSHREWNISDDELARFVEIGLFTREELEQAVVRRYERGLIKFYSQNIPEPPAELWLDHVLDVAIDLGTLLEMAREKFEAAGGVALDLRALKKVYITENGPVCSVVEVENQAGQVERYGACLTINALGAISPLSLLLQGGKPFDGICPTVGSTVKGLKVGSGPFEVDPKLGDVLISVADAQKNRQLIWEGFPGKGNEMTVYVFYYDLVSPERATSQSLLDLFESYFELLPTYKKTDLDFAHLKPVYGFI